MSVVEPTVRGDLDDGFEDKRCHFCIITSSSKLGAEFLDELISSIELADQRVLMWSAMTLE